jgi:hypothetical protein
VVVRVVAAAGVTVAGGLWKHAVERGGVAAVSAPAAGCCNSGDAWLVFSRSAWENVWRVFVREDSEAWWRIGADETWW